MLDKQPSVAVNSKDDSVAVSPKGDNASKCPQSPSPDKYPRPAFPSEDYFNKQLAKSVIEQINAELTKANNVAIENRTDAKHQAEDVYQSASAEFAGAQKKQIRDKERLEERIIHKKGEILDDFKKALREHLPKNFSPSNTDPDIVDDPRVPRDKFAICLANFNKSLSDEEINYLNTLKSINDQKADADSKWQKAQETYQASKCSAEAILTQAQNAAEITRRTKISDELQKLLCNQ